MIRRESKDPNESGFEKEGLLENAPDFYFILYLYVSFVIIVIEC